MFQNELMLSVSAAEVPEHVQMMQIMPAVANQLGRKWCIVVYALAEVLHHTYQCTCGVAAVICICGVGSGLYAERLTLFKRPVRSH